jgi:hypothetical protein
MARHQRRDDPVSDEEFESMPDRIGAHFETIQERLSEALDEDDA